MKDLKHIKSFNEAQENLNISDVSNSLYQDNSTRRPNGLLFKMRELFNNETLTTWEYGEFMRMVQSFAKENNYHFDKDKEQLYRRGE